MNIQGYLERTAIIAVFLASAAIVSAVAMELPDPVPCNGSCYRPVIGDRWQWQLTCTSGVPGCVKILRPEKEIRFYDIDWEENSALTVAKIHESGAKAIAYISAGSWENWRSDKRTFPDFVIGKAYRGWPGERWLDVRCTSVLLPIMEQRMRVAKKKGFDGVQFDNLGGYQARTGYPLTKEDCTYYGALLANSAHETGLSAAWENAVEIREPLLPYYDWFLMEECRQYDECGCAATFIDAGKFVGGVEYTGETSSMSFCRVYARNNVSGMLKHKNLGSWRNACPG
jgi:hypothetical protein